MYHRAVTILPICTVLLNFLRFDFRLLDVCHGQLERERQLVLFLVFEHLEEDLAGYLNRVGDRGVPPRTIQVLNYSYLKEESRQKA